MTKIKIELTDEEFQALQQLMDAGVRASGMAAVRAAAHLLIVFEEAVKASGIQDVNKGE